MNYLLDTNSCIYLLVNAYPQLTARVSAQASGSLGISVITYGEIAFGTHNGRPPSPEVLATFVREIPIVDFDRAAAEVYARLPFRRGSFDRLIAAHALSLGLSLVSRNLRDFADIGGLKVEDWTR